MFLLVFLQNHIYDVMFRTLGYLGHFRMVKFTVGQPAGVTARDQDTFRDYLTVQGSE
jgi:hypothetical protein